MGPATPKSDIWWYLVTVWGFRKINKISFSGKYNNLGGIPRTLRNCSFAIRFDNGGHGCVSLGESLCQQVPEKNVIVTQIQILLPKWTSYRFCIISIPTRLPYYIRAPPLLSADAGNMVYACLRSLAGVIRYFWDFPVYVSSLLSAYAVIYVSMHFFHGRTSCMHAMATDARILVHQRCVRLNRSWGSCTCSISLGRRIGVRGFVYSVLYLLCFA
jgi:hypothetical protein